MGNTGIRSLEQGIMKHGKLLSIFMVLIFLVTGVNKSVGMNAPPPPDTSTLEWVFLPSGGPGGLCPGISDCCQDTLCYGLLYTPSSSGELTSYTTGFFVNCVGGLSPVGGNMSCVMADNSFEINGCMAQNRVLFNSSGNTGSVMVTAGVPIFLHKVCFYVPVGTTLTIVEDPVTDLTASIKIDTITFITEHPSFDSTLFFRTPPVAPADDFTTVECLDEVEEQPYPAVFDMCGNPIIPSLDSVVNYFTIDSCEGSVVYYYTFTDCSGQTDDWTFTFIIDHTIPPSESGGPVPTSVTFSCPDSIGLFELPVVLSGCGDTLDIVFFDIGGTFDGCEGTLEYEFLYLDCSGLSFEWTFTETIDLNPFVLPANDTMTVACPAATNTLPTLPIVEDDCGFLIDPVGPPVVSAQVVCEGTRTYTYTYEDCAGNSADWVFTYTVERLDFVVPAFGSLVVTCPAMTDVVPPLPVITDNCGEVLIPVDTLVTGPVICEGTRTYTFIYMDCEGNTHNWFFTYTVERTEFATPPNGFMTVACPAAAEIPPTLPVVTDNCGNVLTAIDTTYSSIPISCEGNKIYVYTYVDCEGNMATWTFTYTVERLPFADPMDASTTVDCPADAALPPTSFLPVVIDNCGNVLSPSAPVVSGTVSCEGNVTWTYIYTDCEGNSQNWVFTYMVERQPFVTPPAGMVTVPCPANAAIPPSAYLPVVLSDCGDTLSPVLISSGIPVVCEGTRLYVYSYTDCEGNTATWNFTYVVDRPLFANPVDAGATVACPSGSNVVPTAFLPTVVDSCGVTLLPVGPMVSPFVCVGTRTYTYVYTDCAGNTQDWVFTYTISPNTSLVVNCPANLVLNCTTTNYGPQINAWLASATATDACDPLPVITNNYDGMSIPDFSCTDGLPVTFTATDNCGNTATCTAFIRKPCFNLETWVYIEGAAANPNGSANYVLPMRTTLNDLRILPGQLSIDPFFGNHYTLPGQPYNVAPWLYPGTEGAMFDSGNNPLFANAGYPSTVVDWVLVSLRADSAGTGGPVCQAAALLHRDGVIQFVEPLDCCGVNEDSLYYVVIEQRNHLIVMSHVFQQFINHKLSYDFRSQQSYEDPLFAGLNLFARQKELVPGNPGKFAMFAGNGQQTISLNADTDINFDDRSFWETQNGQIGAYRIGDHNLNGDTNFNDRIVWERNNGKFSSVQRN